MGERVTEGSTLREVAARDFRQLCQLAGKSKTQPLGYGELEGALRLIPGETYRTVTFRHEIVSREGHEGAAQVLTAASRSDEGQLFCFFRAMDHDCDGLVSKEDYCNAVEEGLMDLWTIDQRWDEMSLALERPQPVPHRVPEAGREELYGLLG